jgi:hypothetical protein
VTSAQIATFVTMAAALALIVLLAVVGTPRLAGLVFVYRLEVIRDNCMDAILDDKLHESTSVRRFLRGIETATAWPEHLTLPYLFAVSQEMVAAGIDVARLGVPPKYDDLGDRESRFMLDLDARMCDAYRSYLNWASPVGWLLRPITIVVSRIRPRSTIAIARGAVHGVAREILRQPIARHGRRGFLYKHCAGR